MKMNFIKRWLLIFLVGSLGGVGVAAPFIHPGGLHTLADLERMKTNVLAGLAITGEKKDVFNTSVFDHVIMQKPPSR